MGLGHVPPRPFRETGESDDVPRHQHRRARALDSDLSRRRRTLARTGEQLAARFLETRGFRIIGRNVRVGRGEIDLIAESNGRLVAIEVKTVGPDVLVSDPIDRISDAKLRQVRRLANDVAAGRDIAVDFLGVRLDTRGVHFTWRRRVA